MKTLILFTGSYPFSARAENTFIPQEIAELSKRFQEIVIVPRVALGSRDEILLPNVRVETDYSFFLESKENRRISLIGLIFDRVLWVELIKKAFFFIKNPGSVKSALQYRLISVMTEKWIRRYLSSNCLESEGIILETWWFDESTLGLANFSVKRKNVSTVTRTHGFDLYEERSRASYIPFRHAALRDIHYVFSASQAGADYLAKRYPVFSQKIKAGILGVHDPGFNNKASTDGKFRILTCSSLIPLKRIGLLIYSLEQLAIACPEERFEWYHIGTGPDLEELQLLAKQRVPRNVEVNFCGFLSKSEIYEFYLQQSIDLFINVSSTEGTPVSIMEAISLGIPILATDVGGNTEIVSRENGVLVDANPSPNEIADAIIDLKSQKSKLLSMRAGSKNQWRLAYNAGKNYDTFADEILNAKRPK